MTDTLATAATLIPVESRVYAVKDGAETLCAMARVTMAPSPMPGSVPA